MLRVVGQGLLFELLHDLVFPAPSVQRRREVTGIRHPEGLIEGARQRQRLPGVVRRPVGVAQHPQGPPGVDRAGDAGRNEPKQRRLGRTVRARIEQRDPALEVIEGRLELAGVQRHDAQRIARHQEKAWYPASPRRWSAGGFPRRAPSGTRRARRRIARCRAGPARPGRFRPPAYTAPRLARTCARPRAPRSPRSPSAPLPA